MAMPGIILFAEDDRKLRKLYTDAFEAAGYNILSATDGDDALNLLNRVKPKVLLLDIMMPGLGGIETCRRARKIVGREVPIVFLTALDDLGTLQECIAAGGDDYLIKSQSVATVVERVGQWMQRPYGSKNLVKRRQEVLAGVNAEAGKDAGGVRTGALLSSENDESVREISEFLREARAEAPDEFGKTVKEKLYLLGYVTGVVECWAQLRGALEDRFIDYVGSVLNETGILKDNEVPAMLSEFDTLSNDICFGIARAHGRNDTAQRQSQGTGIAPIGLCKFHMLTGL